ncbi:MAG: glutamyl-tRNA reductase [Chloroflexi bacterium]|nr:glutamyl-tRNA reductase [Chloroflexota bacterium]
MHIHCLGLNHTTAPITLREKLDFGDEALQAALARLGCGSGLDHIAELVILSTCNRVELYAASNESAFDSLETFLSEARDFPVSELHPHLYQFMDEEAIQHLMKVAAGLDSLVVGEPQILGQVTHALELARGQGAAGPLLNRLFRAAIHAGKRARTETEISRNPASVSSLAASLCQHAHPDLKTAEVVVLGAGEMAELAVEALRKRGVEKILVVNRTLERARGLAKRWNAETATFESLQDALTRADILIASTGAPHTLIHPEMVHAAMERRLQRSLVLIDIAVPRDIDPEVVDIPHVRLYDIDNLNEHLEQSLAERAVEVPRVESILVEEQEKFVGFFNSLNMLPLITDLRQRAETIRQNELEKTFRRLPDLTEAERARIEALTQALVKKILDAPTQRLRAEAGSPRAPEYAEVARALFNLTDGQSYPASFAAD